MDTPQIGRPGPGSTPRPQRSATEDHLIVYSVEVNATAQEVFALVSDPHRHHELDGSGTVQPRAFGPRELKTGDRFSVAMRIFGVPYRLPLRVLRAAPPVGDQAGVLEWVQPTGHRWRWEMTSVADHPERSVVTEAFDARSQNPLARRALTLLNVHRRNAAAISASLERLQRRYSEDF